MGVGIWPSGRISRSVYDNKKQDPDPLNYKILQSFEMGKFLILEIKYLNCTNYEGKKILVYENTTLLELFNQKYLDPHFSNDTKYKSPLARFEPTERGLEFAKEFCKYLDSLSLLTLINRK